MAGVDEARPRVQVALPIPAPQTFTYAVPEGMDVPAPGSRVLVPFGRHERIGWAVDPGADLAEGRLRPLLSVLDTEPTVTPEILTLSRWISRYYLAPLGLVLRAALPALLSDASRDRLTVAVGAGADGLRGRDLALFERLQQSAGPRQVQALRRELGGRSIWPSVRRLVADGRIHHTFESPRRARPRTVPVLQGTRWLGTLEERDRLFRRAPRQRALLDWLEAAGGRADLADARAAGFAGSLARALVDKGVARLEEEVRSRDPFTSISGERGRPEPTPDQARVLEDLDAALAGPPGPPRLLHGITGSGKTLVYMDLLEAVLTSGRGGIVLVPEISLTPQAVSRFRGRFGDRVAVLHSGLSRGERFDAWRELRSGARTVAIGARSAIFAPVSPLGLVVVDEEHDSSYKQSEAPRYHARDVAVVRAHAEGALCILGSATPSLESWQNGRTGKYRVLSLPRRATGAELPPVTVVDLRERAGPRTAEPSTSRSALGEGGVVLSDDLAHEVRECLGREEQAILLLNRRGYSSFLQCMECGDVRPCPHCAVSLTYHRTARRLLCHHCGHEEPVPGRCDRCGAEALSYRGLGTEQVERVVADAFPSARIARMDVDTTSGKWSHQRILGRVDRGEVDILLGTQMIAKGLDFERVTLVGVINADVGLHLPDFRASERTFQLVSQVAGRAGRGARGGRVLVQTRVPDHYAIRHAASHDYVAFAERELSERAGPGYPPHVRLLNVILSSPEQEAAADAAAAAVRWVRPRAQAASVVLTGPAPAPIERLHGRWRWHFLLRARRAQPLEDVGWALQSHFTVSGDVRLVLDRDPVALL